MTTRCCLERAYRGCPDPVPEPGAPAPWDEVTPNDWIQRTPIGVRNAVLEEAAAVCETGWKLGIGGQYQGDVFAVAIRAMKENCND